MERKFNRRNFLELSALVAMWAVTNPKEAVNSAISEETLSPVRFPEGLAYCRLLANPRLTMTNTIDIENILPRNWNAATESCAVNFAAMYNHRAKDFLNLDPQTGGDLWGKGNEINEAIKRNRRVFLTVEFPGGNSISRRSDPVTLENWATYIGALARQYPASHFILGNEINAGFNKWWEQRPNIYVDYFLTAASAIQKTSPQSIILPYAEAYNENGENLEKVLSILQRRGALRLIGGLPFHYYDVPGRMEERVKMYQKIARKFGIKPDLFLTELGKPETKTIGQNEHEYYVVENTATALALADIYNIQTVIWHTAYQPSSTDPYGHSLTIDKNGRRIPKPVFLDLFRTGQLLHHGISMEVLDGVTIVAGRTSDDDLIIIVWDNGLARGVRQSVFGLPLEPPTNRFTEGKPLIFLQTASSSPQNPLGKTRAGCR